MTLPSASSTAARHAPNETRRRAWGMLFPSRRRVSTLMPRAFELYG